MTSGLGSPDDRTTPEALGELSDRCRLVVLWEGKSITRLLVPGAAVVVGRSSDCDVAIDHTSVSRRHALVRIGRPATIEDLGSSNGVRVRGARIEPRTPTAFYGGDVVELGSACLMLQYPPEHEGGRSSPAKRVEGPVAAIERLVERVARSDLTVLLLGDTGVGKGVTAERIHRLSPRSAQPMLRVDCAALPESMLEAELFGYERGAFTGAAQSKPGLLEAADGGTILLDEVGEMPLATQAKLLGVLETRELLRLGSVKPRRIDVRFVAATNRDLEALVRAGSFRRDLFFRLNGVSIELPPLRARLGDVADLAEALLADACRRAGRAPVAISPSAMRWLVAHEWPGNIRELKNVLERALVLSASDRIELADVEKPKRAGDPPSSTSSMLTVSAEIPGPSTDRGASEAAAPSLRAELEALERQRIEEALRACEGNQTKAARRLGLSRRALIDRMEAYGFPRPRRR